MAGIERFGFRDDVECATHLIEQLGVATVPASSFYHRPELGAGRVRFSYPKRLSTIERGLAKLEPLRARAAAGEPA
jgi:aminotransferase